VREEQSRLRDDVVEEFLRHGCTKLNGRGEGEADTRHVADCE